jgi:hypothetical protein
VNDKPTVTNAQLLELSRLDVETLMREIENYLAVVQAFRRAGCEPHWRSQGLWLDPG